MDSCESQSIKFNLLFTKYLRGDEINIRMNLLTRIYIFKTDLLTAGMIGKIMNPSLLTACTRTDDPGS